MGWFGNKGFSSAAKPEEGVVVTTQQGSAAMPEDLEYVQLTSPEADAKPTGYDAKAPHNVTSPAGSMTSVASATSGVEFPAAPGPSPSVSQIFGVSGGWGVSPSGSEASRASGASSVYGYAKPVDATRQESAFPTDQQQAGSFLGVPDFLRMFGAKGGGGVGAPAPVATTPSAGLGGVGEGKGLETARRASANSLQTIVLQTPQAASAPSKKASLPWYSCCCCCGASLGGQERERVRDPETVVVQATSVPDYGTGLAK